MLKLRRSCALHIRDLECLYVTVGVRPAESNAGRDSGSPGEANWVAVACKGVLSGINQRAKSQIQITERWKR
jgi:hypothetical protein